MLSLTTADDFGHKHESRSARLLLQAPDPCRERSARKLRDSGVAAEEGLVRPERLRGPSRRGRTRGSRHRIRRSDAPARAPGVWLTRATAACAEQYPRAARDRLLFLQRGRGLFDRPHRTVADLELRDDDDDAERRDP